MRIHTTSPKFIRLAVLSLLSMFIMVGCGSATIEDAPNGADASAGTYFTHDGVTSDGGVSGDAGAVNGASDSGSTLAPEQAEDDEIDEPDDGDDANAHDTPKVPAITPPKVTLCKVGGPSCAKGQYCKASSCGKGAAGICTARPAKCLINLTVASVCGCDGKTYKNGCLAARSGVNVASKGVCPITTPKTCVSGKNNCAEGEFCKAIGCGYGQKGLCVKRPTKCIIKDSDKPLCGCNGETYDNVCDASRDGVNIKSEGVCKVVKSCIKGVVNCGKGSYCESTAGLCATIGTCKVKPIILSSAVKPVCGCDGKTYENDTLRRLAGVSLSHNGVCFKVVKTACVMGGDDCDSDSYCHAVDGKCTGLGLCQKRPKHCEGTTLSPVCGCDGKAYFNGCVAAINGTPGLSIGHCAN